jgi:hypothetical protein
MAKVLESVQGPSSSTSQMRQESRPNDRGSWLSSTRSTCRCLRSRTPKAERGNPVSPPVEGQSPIFPHRSRRVRCDGRDRSGSPPCPRSSLTSQRPGSFRVMQPSTRQADRKGSPWSCGTGCWKKRMPFCNEADTGSEFARRESEQTSSRCPFARSSGEPT